MNDAQLVEACLEGDHRAYADMVELVDEWERAERVWRSL